MQEENGLWECECSEGNYSFKKHTSKRKSLDSSLSRKKKKIRKHLPVDEYNWSKSVNLGEEASGDEQRESMSSNTNFLIHFHRSLPDRDCFLFIYYYGLVQAS